MATTGSGYIRPAMPMPPEASPNHCQPQPPILRNRGASVSSTSAASSVSVDQMGISQPSPGLSSDSYILGTDLSQRAGADGVQAARPRRLSAVHFAPLPVVPPELKRRSSITLGVAARKNLLSSQNGGAAKPKTGVVYMTDQEWEDYKRQYEARPEDDPVDLGELVSTGVRSLWRKVKTASSERRGSNSSVGSTSSLASTSTSSANTQYRGLPSPGAKPPALLPVKEEHTPIHSAAPSAPSSPLLRGQSIPADGRSLQEAMANIGDRSQPEALEESSDTPVPPSPQSGRQDQRFGLRRHPSDSKYGATSQSKHRNESAVLGFNAESHRPSTDLLQNMVRDVRI